MTNITISLDAMGGEGAPGVVLEGISLILAQDNNVNFLLFGDEKRIKEAAFYHNVDMNSIQITHTAEVVLDDDKPIDALRYGVNTSMRKAIDAVQTGQAAACISGGNTGALMVMAKMVIGALPAIRRPAIIATFPTLNGKSVMLDLGANTECNEEILFQFALMGYCFAKTILNKDNPSIAILNIGSEDVKGRSLEQKTAQLLRQSNLNFIGYIEGHDIAEGKSDIIVTDGFSGNLVLKASEGAAHMFFNIMKRACTETGLLAKIGALLLKKALKQKFDIVNPSLNNGAMFVGLNGIVVKSHGSADALGMKNAIKVAIQLARSKVNEQISLELKQLEEQGIYLNIMDRIKHTSAKILGIGGK